MPYVDHQHVNAFGGLYTSASFADEFQAKTYKGLPHYTVVAGRKKLATASIAGILDSTTTITNAITHSAMTSVTVGGAGKAVEGVLTSLTLSGKKADVINFSLEVKGKTATPPSSTPAPGTLAMLEDATITVGSNQLSVLEFNLNASWDVEFIWGADVYPTVADTIFKSFDGTLSVKLNATPDLSNTLSEVSFSISIALGANKTLSITGAAYETTQTAEDTPDEFYAMTREFTISELTIQTVTA